MKYFLVSGETSGDLHGAMLIAQLKKQDPNAEFIGTGGDKMLSAGCQLVQHISNMAFMGVVAVVKNLKKVIHNFRLIRHSLIIQKPDMLILIDYPSFNLKIAAFCKKHLPQTKIVYYIPPKVWAWKTYRIHRIARLSDLILCIFPFEVDFYKKYNYRAIYVGNPTKEEVSTTLSNNHFPADTIALLPGSRLSEVQNCLPRMLSAARQFPDYQIQVCAAPRIPQSVYQKYMLANEVLIENNTYQTIRSARAAVVNSGTATLETALIGTPQVAVYHIAFSTPFLVKLFRPILFKIPYFTLVNLIANKEVIQELVADRFTADNIQIELNRLLFDEQYRFQIKSDYKNISNILSDKQAAAEAATQITKLL